MGFLNYSASNNSTVYQFTTAPGSGVIVGTNGVAGLDGLAFDVSDVLYGLGQTDRDNLYTVNQSTGALTLVGPTGVAGSNGLGGLDFVDGVLYAVINNSLYTLNPATGAATLVGHTGFTGVSGLASLDTVPEPASLLLIGGGLLGLVARRRARA